MAPPLVAAMLTIAPHLVVQVNDLAVLSSVQGRDEAMEQCVGAGLELRYRFDFELCRKRSLWFDSCGGVRSEIASLRYEPVSDVFVVRRDLHGDGADPSVQRFSNAADAFAASSSGSPVSYDFLAQGNKKLAEGERRYIRARATAWCKEERDRTLERVSEGLTFGLVKREQFDSGWQEKKIGS